MGLIGSTHKKSVAESKIYQFFLL